ncbi:glycerophosphodiester phosphodiesterase family protein [Clavibacter tessellarius]|uniref:glycerophosphodiester phosphodiesterase family protein n=1 Tax=Clavibacter tessellarius TaxID=31965 RepID=UPI0032511A3E
MAHHPEDAPGDARPVRYLDDALPRVLAHRGGIRQATVENTLGAFRAAWDAGVTHLETDARATADGACVLWHDADLRRLTGDRRRVEDMTLAELRAIDLGSGARVTTLAELLRALPSARVNVDVKGRSAPAAVAREVRDADAVGRVLVTSFSGSRRRRAVALLPGSRRRPTPVASSSRCSVRGSGSPPSSARPSAASTPCRCRVASWGSAPRRS